MTDRQMIEDAALAAGMEIEWKEGHCKGGPYAGAFVNGVAWRPGEDDGDALRLAVKLRLAVIPWADGSAVSVARVRIECELPPDLDDDWHCALEDVDESATARLAIVRAAAAIGAKMRETKEG